MDQSALATTRAKRDVYVSDFTVNGHRWAWSVDSHGEQSRLVTIAPGEDWRPKVAQLWADLNRDDPVTPPSVSRRQHLRIVTTDQVRRSRPD